MAELQRELEHDIEELQFEMMDFFHEVERVDLLVSDVLTFAYLIWLACCTFAGYKFVVYNRTNVPPLMYLVLCAGFIILALTSFFLLKLRRSCLRSYMVLSSLMANDRTLKKRHLVKLLDFFTQLNRTTYTLCQRPYRPTTFVNIVGWSFSCFFIALNLFGGRLSASQLLQPLEPSPRPLVGSSN